MHALMLWESHNTAELMANLYATEIFVSPKDPKRVVRSLKDKLTQEHETTLYCSRAAAMKAHTVCSCLIPGFVCCGSPPVISQ